MSRKIINIGSANFAGDGEPIRDALTKVNQNFEEVYNNINAIEIPDISNFITADDIPTDLKGSVFADDSTLMIDGINGKIVGPLEGNSFSGTIDFTGTTITGLNFVPVEYRTAYTDDSVIYTVDLFQFKMTGGDLQMRLVTPAGIVVSASISSVENINGTISGNITGTLTLSDSTWSTINGTTTASHGDTIVATVVSPQDGRMYRVTVFRGEIAGFHRVIIETLAK